MVYTKREAHRIAYFGAVKMHDAESGYVIEKQSAGYYFVTTPDGANVYGVLLASDGKTGTCGCKFWEAAREYEVCKHITACHITAKAERHQTALDLEESGDADFNEETGYLSTVN